MELNDTDFEMNIEELKVSKTEPYIILAILGDLQRHLEQADLDLSKQVKIVYS